MRVSAALAPSTASTWRLRLLTDRASNRSRASGTAASAAARSSGTSTVRG